MAFHGNEGGRFPIETASKWIKNFRLQNPKGKKAHFYGENIIKEILAQEECVGIRFYNALDENNEHHLIMVGADKFEKDLTSGIIAQIAMPCPPWCDYSSLMHGYSPVRKNLEHIGGIKSALSLADLGL